MTETAIASPSSSSRHLRALLLGSAIAAVLAVILFVGLGRAPSRNTGSAAGSVVAVGTSAPDFTLPALFGATPVHLDALGAGSHRPVVLNFFASWCGPCRQETPLLAKTARTAGSSGSSVQFVGVDVNDPAGAAQQFATRSGITYPVGVDADLTVSSGLYGLTGQPQTFFIDRSGTVVGHSLGAVDRSTLERWLHRLTGSAR